MLSLIYSGIYQPKSNQVDHSIDLMNQYLNVVLASVITVFTNFVSDVHSQDLVGWVVIALMVSYIFINLAYIATLSFKNVKKSCMKR